MVLLGVSSEGSSARSSVLDGPALGVIDQVKDALSTFGRDCCRPGQWTADGPITTAAAPSPLHPFHFVEDKSDFVRGNLFGEDAVRAQSASCATGR